MVTPAPASGGRPSSTASPFGLVADLGAAVAADLGVPLAQIARFLGPMIGDSVARAAVVRGRRELAARRTHRLAVLRPPAEPRGLAPGRPASASPVPDLPPPDEIPDADPAEVLLLWAERGPQEAATRAARVRVLLGQIAEIQRTSRRNHRKSSDRTKDRRDAVPLPPDATVADRRAYFAQVRAWATENGRAVPDGKVVSTGTVRAYEAARAAGEPAAELPAPPEPKDADEVPEVAPILVPEAVQSAVAFEAVTRPFLDDLTARQNAAAARATADSEYLARAIAAACAAPAAAEPG